MISCHIDGGVAPLISEGIPHEILPSERGLVQLRWNLPPDSMFQSDMIYYTQTKRAKVYMARCRTIASPGSIRDLNQWGPFFLFFLFFLNHWFILFLKWIISWNFKMYYVIFTGWGKIWNEKKKLENVAAWTNSIFVWKITTTTQTILYKHFSLQPQAAQLWHCCGLWF